MSLSSTSIQRPVLTIVMGVVIILFGVIGYSYLGVREFPSVDPPVINVQSTYVGANADVIESQITEPLEASINGISGVKSIQSTSREGRSSITVEFDLGVDLEAAANDVRDRVSRAVSSLPKDMDPPVVSKADANANPIVYLNVFSSTRDQLETSRIANDIFKERLQTIPGVSEVQIYGEKKYSMRLYMDPARLGAYKITPIDVQNAVSRENVELPTGRIEGSAVELNVRTMGRLTDAESFNKLVIAKKGDQVVRLEDVGYARLEAENQRSNLKRNGQPMVVVVLIPQPGANNIAIAGEMYRRLEIIKRDLPPDVEVAIAFDTTKFIRMAITEVMETLAIAFLLVVMVIFLFLRDWRSTVIPMVAIPVSLIGAFFIMYVMGFSINVLTLLAIVLSIGLVVDDAIVVLENIYHKIENGMEPMEAGRRGSTEIYFAVISTTVVLVVVFLPVVFLQGFVGRLFREFGVVVAGAVLISMFVALSLTPMMATRLLKHREKPNWFYRATEPFFVALINGYRNSLQSFLGARWLGWAIMAFCAVGIYFLYRTIPSELAPQEDRSNMRVNSTAPEGVSFEYMDRFMDQVAKMVRDSIPEVETVISISAPGFSGGSANSGTMNLFLKDPTQRTRTQQQVAIRLGQEMAKYSAARTFITQPQTITTDPRGGGLPVQYVILAPNFAALSEKLPAFVDEARKDPTFAAVDVNLKFNKPELRLEIDRAKARNLNVSVLDIARTLQLTLSETRYGYMIMNGKQYQIIGQLLRDRRAEPLDLRSMYVRSQDGQLIQLDNLVNTKEVVSPPQLYRYNRYVSATVSGALQPGKTIGDGIKAMDAIKARVLDKSFATTLSGPSRDYAESSSSLGFAFALALVMIYLVLAAQFESFRDPFVILFTVPLALAGALFSLWYFNQTLNIFSQIGIIMLIGLVTKNGILIVEFANQRKEEGVGLHDAALDAAVSRFRPIVMTSLCAALGFLPIALALGAGAESRVSMGIVVVGGVLFSTFLSLYVIPALYTFLSRVKKQHAVSQSPLNPELAHTAA
jgi:multidrug efflux pump